MRYLFYQGAISAAGVRNAQILAWDAVQAGESEITLCLASQGGDVNSGIGLHNYLKMMPIVVNTHAAGLCASIAVTVLLAGQRRSASSVSMFMTHQASFSEGPQIGQRSPNTDLIAQPFKSIANWSDADIALRFGPVEFSFSPPEAQTLRIVHSITDIKLGPQDLMININVP